MLFVLSTTCLDYFIHYALQVYPALSLEVLFLVEVSENVVGKRVSVFARWWNKLKYLCPSVSNHQRQSSIIVRPCLNSLMKRCNLCSPTLKQQQRYSLYNTIMEHVWLPVISKYIGFFAKSTRAEGICFAPAESNSIRFSLLPWRQRTWPSLKHWWCCCYLLQTKRISPPSSETELTSMRRCGLRLRKKPRTMLVRVTLRLTSCPSLTPFLSFWSILTSLFPCHSSSGSGEVAQDLPHLHQADGAGLQVQRAEAARDLRYRRCHRRVCALF